MRAISGKNKMGIKQIIKRKIIHRIKSSNELLVSDTTLRDGEQMPGGTLFAYEKADIAKYLEKIGVHSIDAGFPICSYDEIESVRKVAEAIRNPIVTALCRAREEDIDSAFDALAEKSVYKKGVSIFIGTSPQHREYKLGKTKNQIIDIMAKNVKYALERGFEIVSMSAEDASRTELDFLVDFYKKAIEAGAMTIGFPDTLGILDPEKTKRYVEEVNNRLENISEALFAIHFHNDFGMAVANSLAAIKTGYVDIVQGTLLGVGERAGNSSLEQIIMAINCDIGEPYPKKPRVSLKALKPTCEKVAEYMGLEIPLDQPIIGKNIFRTEAGIHKDGIQKNPETYEPFSPEIIGAEREFILGKHSGRHALLKFLEEKGIHLSEEELERFYYEFKSWFSDSKTISQEEILELADKKSKEEIVIK